MELLFDCPNCKKCIVADRNTIQEYNFYGVDGFEIKGNYDIECPYCGHRIGMIFTANLVDYEIRS